MAKGRKKNPGEYGKGSLEETTTKRGESRWRILYYEGGKRKASPRFKVDDHAKAWFEEYQRTNGASASTSTFRDAAERWLAGRKARPARLALYGSILRGHLYPVFGDTLLRDITDDDINAYLFAKRIDTPGSLPVPDGFKPKLANQTLYEHKEIIRSIYAAAIDSGRYTGINPGKSKNLSVGATSYGQPRYMGAVDMKRLWRVCPHDDKPLLGLLIHTGIRFGEAAALQWENWNHSQLQVFTAVKAERVIDLPKSKTSVRTLGLSPDVDALLLQHHRFIENKSGRPSRADYMFLNSRGGWLDHRSYNRYVLTPLCAKAGIPKFTVHQLRHTFAHNQLTATPPVNIVQLSQMMGHHDVGFTLRTYGGYLPDEIPSIAPLSLG